MKLTAVLCCVLLALNVASQHSLLETAFSKLNDDQQKAIGTTLEAFGSKLRQLQNQAKDGQSLFGFERELGSIWQNPVTCGACKAGLATFDYVIDSSIVRNTLETTVAVICSIFSEYEVCKGAITEMGNVIVPQMTEFLLSPSYGCSRLVGMCSSPQWRTLDSDDYIERVLADKPDFIKDNNYVNEQYKEIREDQNERKTVKVMHISDVHLDFDYTEGANKNCDEPLCCRIHTGMAKEPSDAAGKYGSLADCDLPPITAEMIFDFVENMEEQPDVLFWTGDNIAHDIWNQSAHKNADYTIRISQWIQEHLPATPVFPTPGNHEFFPVNAMNFDGNDEIIEQLSQVWARWLDQESLEMFKKYGYYSMSLRGASNPWNGFRVIALNTETCNHQNWYLFSQTSDPGGMLTWVEQEFKKAEENDEKLFVIGHVKTGEDACLYEWSVRYRALMERYQHLIVANLFGHTHTEDLNLISDTTNEDIIHVEFTPGSVTTYSDHNPQFRIYDVDYETGYPVKAYKYVFNITGADMGDPKWELQYELTDAYEIPDMAPESFLQYTDSFLTNPDAAATYLWNQNGRAYEKSYYECQDDSCRKYYYCMLRNIIYFEEKDCNGLPRMDYIHDLERTIYETFFDPWVEQISFEENE